MNSSTIALPVGKATLAVLAALGAVGLAGTAHAECLTSWINITAVADQTPAQSVPTVIEAQSANLATGAPKLSTRTKPHNATKKPLVCDRMHWRGQQWRAGPSPMIRQAA